MRVLLASGAVLGAAALAAGGVTLAGASPRHRAPAHRASPRHSAPAHRATLDASSACSSVSGCVQGCALPVALVKRSPRSPTSPCSQRSSAGCTEYVAARPAKRSSGCTGIVFGERLRAPGRPGQLEPFSRLDRRAAERAAREALSRGRPSSRRSRRRAHR